MDFGKIIKLVQGIILKPKETFVSVKDDKPVWTSLFVNYVLILIALPAIGNFLMWIRWSGSWAVRSLIMQYILAGLSFVLLMYLMQVLSKSFGGNGDLSQSAKTIAYSLTPAWIAQFFMFIPILGWLISLAGGIYALIVLYHAIIVFMDVPKDKSIGFEIIFIIVSIVVMVILSMILFPIFGLSMMASGHMRF